MSRPTITSTLRPLFHARPQPIASTSYLTHQFSTSSPLSASRSKQNAKRKKAKVLGLRSARQAEDSNPPDPVLGQFISSSRQGASTSGDGNGMNKWEGCRLQRTLLTPEMVYSAPLLPGDRPNYIHGLSSEDKDLLFGGLPYTTLSLASTTPTSNSENGIIEQENQVESIRRILDLRNASKPGIEVVNRQRIVEEFGRKRVMLGEGEWGYEGEPQSGGSEVQGMLFSLFSVFRTHPFFFLPTYLSFDSLGRWLWQSELLEFNSPGECQLHSPDLSSTLNTLILSSLPLVSSLSLSLTCPVRSSPFQLSMSALPLPATLARLFSFQLFSLRSDSLSLLFRCSRSARTTLTNQPHS
jgi:hypothetical protein